MENKKIPLITHIIASGLYTGHFPLFPGTVGSALAFFVFLIFKLHSSLWFLPLIILTFIIGTIVSYKIEKILGNDPSVVVIDEIVGMWAALIYLPNNFFLWIAAFFVFRAFDIVKPFPCRQLEKVNKGIGIMLDDLMAGIYTNLLLQIIYLII